MAWGRGGPLRDSEHPCVERVAAFSRTPRRGAGSREVFRHLMFGVLVLAVGQLMRPSIRVAPAAIKHGLFAARRRRRRCCSECAVTHASKRRIEAVTTRLQVTYTRRARSTQERSASPSEGRSAARPLIESTSTQGPHPLASTIEGRGPVILPCATPVAYRAGNRVANSAEMARTDLNRLTMGRPDNVVT